MIRLRTSSCNRRAFIAGTALATQALLGKKALAAESTIQNPICIFTKPFNSLNFDQLAKTIAELGFNGIEAPIRKGGHIEPHAVPDQLPELTDALSKQGLEITVMTSDINDPDDPLTESVLRTAAMLGIKRYRMKYFRYDQHQSIQSQLSRFHSQASNLAAMNHEFGIQGLYQNHSGKDYCGAAIWDLETLLDGISADDMGVAYDIRHATAEGGTSWPTTWRMIAPRVKTVYIKDFQWGAGTRPVNVPLGEGRVSAEFFKLLKASSFSGPISLHEEYLDHRDPDLVGQHVDAIRKDFSTLQDWLN